MTAHTSGTGSVPAAKRIAQLRAYRSLGIIDELFLLGRNSKIPESDGWRATRYDTEAIKRAVLAGKNIGFRCTPAVFVLDIDPRNGGMESLERLEKRLGVILETIYPTVITGGGGFHFYMRLPAPQKLRGKIGEYPGIDIKQHGGYVVSAGSIHPDTREMYRWKTAIEEFATIPPAPEGLLQLYARPVFDENSEVVVTPGKIPLEIARDVLYSLDPHDYANHDEWINVLNEFHHGTGGNPKAEKMFYEWSIQDTNYRAGEVRETIRTKWDFATNKLRETGGAGMRTFGSMVHRLQASGVDVGPLFAAMEFSGGVDADDTRELSAEEAEAQARELLEPYVNAIEQADAAILLFELDTTERQFRATIEAVARITDTLSRISRENAVYELAKKAGLVSTRSQFEGLVAERTQVAQNDFSIAVGCSALRAKYGEPSRLPDGSILERVIFWNKEFHAFNGVIWQTFVDVESVEGIVMDWISAENKRRQQAGESIIDGSVSGLARNSRVALSGALSPRDASSDPFAYRSNVGNSEIFFTLQNCEVRIDSRTGAISTVEHKPEHFRREALPFNYSPNAQCPVFMRTLDEIFSECTQPSRAIEYVLEILGYALSPRKADYLFFFTGSGANGKTLLGRVLSALGGPMVTTASLTSLDDDRNRFAFEQLIGCRAFIEDDQNSRTVLNDGVLKKIAGEKELTVDRKGKAAVPVRIGVTPIILTNHVPNIGDITYAMQRRLHVIPFDRRFKPHEIDIHRYDKICAELPGVFNVVVQALARFVQRGMQFDRPGEFEERGREDFMRNASPFYGFVEDYLTVEEKDGGRGTLVSVAHLYKAFTTWHEKIFGGSHVMTRTKFLKMMESVGARLHDAKRNKAHFANVKFDEAQFLRDVREVDAEVDAWSDPIRLAEIEKRIAEQAAQEKRRERLTAIRASRGKAGRNAGGSNSGGEFIFPESGTDDDFLGG